MIPLFVKMCLLYTSRSNFGENIVRNFKNSRYTLTKKVDNILSNSCLCIQTPTLYVFRVCFRSPLLFRASKPITPNRGSEIASKSSGDLGERVEGKKKGNSGDLGEVVEVC